MSDSVASRIGVLLVLIAALVSAVANVLMRGVLGLAVFAIADIPLSPLLPGFHGDYLPGIGTIYGLFWPLLMAGIFIITVNRQVPGKWQKSPLTFRSAFMALSTIAMSVILALPFHLYGIWMTHREYGI